MEEVLWGGVELGAGKLESLAGRDGELDRVSILGDGEHDSLELLGKGEDGSLAGAGELESLDGL